MAKSSFYTGGTEYIDETDAAVLLADVEAEAAAAAASATAAASSATAAATSATSAASSASTATSQASSASSSAANAATSATAAATSATAAATSATAAASSATAAASSATSASSASTSSNAAWTLFKNEYLGAKAADPTLDNDGNALVAGALYWNTGTSVLKAYSGSAWIAYSPPVGDMLKSTYDSDGDGIIAIAQGGTGASTAAAARTALAVAPLASPTFTGTPAAPTASVDTNTTQLATTAYVVGQASASGDGTPAMDGTAARGSSTHFARADHVHPTDTSLAPKASPTFTGTPAAPTAAVDTNTTQIATTAMVLAQAASANPVMNGSVAVGTSTRYARADHVHASDTSRAPLASPTFTGTPAAPTAAVGTNTTQLATTEFVQAAHPYLAIPLSTNITLSSGSWTKITFDGTKVGDALSYWDISNYRYKPLQAGAYLVTVTASYSGTSQVQTALAIYKNGGTAGPAAFNDIATSNMMSHSLTYIVVCNGSTDYIEAFINMTASAALTVYGGGDTCMTIVRIAP